MPRDYYEVLGVPKNATQDQIKQAYRSLALKFHPDVNKSKEAETMFREINEAYAVLSDPQKRQQYDSYGPETFNRRYSEEDIFRGFNIQDLFKDLGINFGFGEGDDIFSSMFGQRGPQRDVGRSVLFRMDVSLEDAAKGVDKEFSVKRMAKCSRCLGSGGDPGAKLVKCEVCKGSGYITRVQNSIFGRIQATSTCDNCGGKGKMYDKKCKTCGGRGSVASDERIKITIPAGVEDGSRLIYQGMGDFGKDGSGDLYIEVHVMRHKLFKREGNDILVDVSVPFYTAILGGKVKVPTLKGEKDLDIPAGTQPGEKLVLRNEGMKRSRSSGYGDEIVNINVEIPKSLSKEQRELIEKFSGQKDGEKPGKKWFSFF